MTHFGDKWTEMRHGQWKRTDANSDRPGRQMNRDATWANGKGRTPTMTDLGDRWIKNATWPGADTTNDRSGQQINRNVASPTEKGRTSIMTDLGRQMNRHIDMLYGQQKRIDTNNDRSGRQMHRNATWPTVKGGHQQWQTWETNVFSTEKGGYQQDRPTI